MEASQTVILCNLPAGSRERKRLEHLESTIVKALGEEGISLREKRLEWHLEDDIIRLLSRQKRRKDKPVIFSIP